MDRHPYPSFSPHHHDKEDPNNQFDLPNLALPWTDSMVPSEPHQKPARFLPPTQAVASAGQYLPSHGTHGNGRINRPQHLGYGGPDILPTVHAAVTAVQSFPPRATHENYGLNHLTNYPPLVYSGTRSYSHPLSLSQEPIIDRLHPPQTTRMPRHLPFRTLSDHMEHPVPRGTWNAPLGTGPVRVQSPPPRMSAPLPSSYESYQDVHTALSTALPSGAESFGAMPSLGKPTSVVPISTVTSAPASSSEKPSLVNFNDPSPPPHIATKARALRLAVRRNTLQRNGTARQPAKRAQEKILPGSSTRAKTKEEEKKEEKEMRRRLNNRTSVQKCRGNARKRNKRLVEEHEYLERENKILLKLKEQIEKSGVLEFVNLDTGLGAASGTSSLPPPAPGHAYHSNPNNGYDIRGIVRSNGQNARDRSETEDARLSRRQRRANVRDGEITPAGHAYGTAGSSRRTSRVEGLQDIHSGTKNLDGDVVN